MQEFPSLPTVDQYLQISGSIRLEIKCPIKVVFLNHPKPPPLHPGPWENSFPQNGFLVPKKVGDC